MRTLVLLLALFLLSAPRASAFPAQLPPSPPENLPDFQDGYDMWTLFSAYALWIEDQVPRAVAAVRDAEGAGEGAILLDFRFSSADRTLNWSARVLAECPLGENLYAASCTWTFRTIRLVNVKAMDRSALTAQIAYDTFDPARMAAYARSEGWPTGYLPDWDGWASVGMYGWDFSSYFDPVPSLTEQGIVARSVGSESCPALRNAVLKAKMRLESMDGFADPAPPIHPSWTTVFVHPADGGGGEPIEYYDAGGGQASFLWEVFRPVEDCLPTD